MKLAARYSEKVWGRTQLPSAFQAIANKRIGEVRFVGDPDLPLVAKYLFTGEKLSIQVHPDDEQARVRGYARGKSECWYILEAEPDSTIGVGLKEEVGREKLRSAALDGSIEALVDWHPVRPGDFFKVSPGMIHAIGSGISLVELHCNSEATFRLYDYGRDRELHVDDAVAIANPSRFPDDRIQHVNGDEERFLSDGPDLSIVVTKADRLQDRRRWVLPLDGSVRFGAETAVAGECLLLDPGERLDFVSGRLLIAAPGSS
jgi:mannose-6-phosphate isomerase